MKKAINALTALMILLSLLTTACPVYAGQASKDVSAEVLQISVHKAIKLALIHNPDISQSELGLRLAKFKLQAARTSAYFPSISFNMQLPAFSSVTGLATDIQGTFAAGLSLPWGTDLNASLSAQLDRITGKASIQSWGISLSQNVTFNQVDNGAKELNGKESAVADARLALQQTRDELVLDVINQFSGLLTKKDQLEEAKADLQTAQKDLVIAEKQVQSGKKGKTFLLEAKLTSLKAQIALKKKQNSYAAAKEAFCRTIGIDQDYEPLPLELPVDQLLAAMNDLLQKNIPSSAIAATSAVKSAQATLTTAEKYLQVTRGDALPKLSLDAGINEDGWKMGIGIAFDLFDPARKTDVKVAQLTLQLAKQQLLAAQEQARNDILDQKTSLREAMEEIAQLKLEEQKWSLEETIDQAKMAAGLLSPTEWREFNAEKQEFYRTEAETEASSLIAYLKYRACLGLETDWEEWLP